MKKILTLISALSLPFFLLAQSGSGFWQTINKSQTSGQVQGMQGLLPKNYQAFSLDFSAMTSHLRQAPMEFTAAATSHPLEVSLPMPDGRLEKFAVWESPIMEPGLAAAFPSIKTFGGRSIDHPAITMRLDYSPQGFHAGIYSPEGIAIVAPFEPLQDGRYISFWTNDAVASAPAPFPLCNVDGSHAGNPDPAHAGDEITANGGDRDLLTTLNLQTYRLAIATTAEFSTDNGGTTASVLAAVTNIVNNINLIYERDNAIRLILINNTTETFFFPPNNADPYMNANPDAMMNANPDVMNNAYGLSGYDVGHVFGTNAGGVAQLFSVCSENKARGASCSFSPYVGPVFFLIPTHEFGHQFSAVHTFNDCDGFQNDDPLTGYEPGSGSTIMSYSNAAGCTQNWVQGQNDPYFHVNSLERIQNFSRNGTTGGSCDQVVAVGNNTPEAEIPIDGGFNIPISTPFQLTGAATDPDGDSMTYVWEQYDVGPPSTLGMPTGTAPLFRSVPPTTSLTRVFPKMETIVNNIANDKAERLPTTTRVLTFRFTARDNKAPAGGWGWDVIQFMSTATAGPFVVTQPTASGITWEVGSYQEVTWNVANTTNNLVNCHWVNIKLSTDGGYTYPVTLLAQTPNDGSAFVVVPNEISTTARVRVEAADNIFFDISNNNFSIVPPAAPGFALQTDIEYGTACSPAGFEVNLETTALLNFSDAITFSASDLPPGATATFTPNPVTPGGTTTLVLDMGNVTVDGDYPITISAEAGGLPVQQRTVDINVVSSDFSALAAVSPANGNSGTTLLPSFQWTNLPNAQFYDIEIATSPNFGNTVVADSFGLTTNTYLPDVTLEENKLYFWHIRCYNECGAGDFSDAFTFYTVSQSCMLFNSTNAPITISGAGLPYITSKISVPAVAGISDVNVKNIVGDHNAFGDIAFRLKSPSGDSVVLMNGAPCGSPFAFNLGFDDQSPLTSIPCPPPTTGANYKPSQQLSAFNGINGQGEWTFVLAVINTIGSGGTFNSWSLELCGTASPINPTLINNDTICAEPGGLGLIVQDQLRVEDTDNTAPQLTFTIVTNTKEGFLTRGGTQLGVGDQFTMQDIYALQIKYNNTNSSATYDYFTFAVTDGTGGLLGTPRVNIKMDPTCVVGTDEQSQDIGFSIYPNPAGDVLNIAFGQAATGSAKVGLLNVEGRQLQATEVNLAVGTIQLNTAGLPAGIYLVQVTTAQGVVSKKVILE
ncbi:MAG: T9SS type A sorting domain-containing protein [Lewinellaceae bacterium]|nr:T9SS type A sorting domain-containing protein [Saprospiraceae bacterium]MCB9339412.1 T9SS type A sorting domain-containing protein [Lewinellaceae bacterium]